MMDTSDDDEIFMGAISDTELTFRKKKKSLCGRKTQFFPNNTAHGSLTCENYSNEIVLNCAYNAGTSFKEASSNLTGDEHVAKGSAIIEATNDEISVSFIPETPCNSGIECDNLAPKESVNTTDKLITPTTCNSVLETEEHSNVNESINDSAFLLENDMEILTIHASDETHQELLFCDQDHLGKENMSFGYHNDTLPIIPKNQLPEMTEKQQDMLRQLWFSPQSEALEYASGSPLMNALDLSTVNEKVQLSKPSTECSLATLDLTVDDRIPVRSYIDEYNNPDSTEEQKRNIEYSGEKNNTQNRQQKTPMKIISHKIGIVNVSSSGNKAKEQSKCPTSGKKNLATPRLSNIPVPQNSQTKAPKPGFKKPLLYNGITMYKSQVSELPKKRFFASPCVSKWNVKSPVAKYINDDPVQPFVKIVRPKEQKDLPTKSLKTASPSHTVAPSSVVKVPIAHYKLRHGKVPTQESTDTAPVQPRMRLFPSPFTPKLTKHEGPARKVVGATSLKLQNSNLSDSRRSNLNSDDSINRSIIRTVISQRSNTLFTQPK